MKKLLKSDIAQYEKAKSELLEVKKKVPEISEKVLTKEVKQAIETKVFTSLKSIIEAM